MLVSAVASELSPGAHITANSTVAIAALVRMHPPSSNASALILPDPGGADDIAILRALGIETARELLRPRELDLHEGRFQPLAHAVIRARRLQLLREPRDDG